MEKPHTTCIMVTEGPSEGGWGWVVVFSSFFLEALNGGCASIFGFFMLHFIQAFGASEATIVWAVSVQSFTLYGSGKHI